MIVRRLERVVAVVHQLRDVRREGREQEAAHAYVVNEHPTFVNDVDHVERLAVLAVGADVVEHLLDSPSRSDGDVVRRHQATDAVFGIAQELDGAGALLVAQEREQLFRDRAGQLFQKGRAVVVGHRVEYGRHVLLAHRLDEFLLLCVRQILEGLGREVARKHPEEKRLIVGVNPADEVCDLRRRQFFERLAQAREVARADGGL